MARLPKEVGAWLALAAGEGEDRGLARPSQLGRAIYTQLLSLACPALPKVLLSSAPGTSSWARADGSSQVDGSQVPLSHRLIRDLSVDPKGRNATLQVGQTENTTTALSSPHHHPVFCHLFQTPMCKRLWMDVHDGKIRQFSLLEREPGFLPRLRQGFYC